jgi:RimJ/RimL family protein N-acetyltransferase
MDITLRPARPEDAEEMARWFVDLTDLAQWGGPDVRFPLTSNQLAGWIAEIAQPTPRYCFTAVDDRDRPIGHVQYLHDPARKWARLGRFAVAPQLRGQGYGRALFDHAVAYTFTRYGLEHLALAVMEENTLARGMYERSGFRHETRQQSVRQVDGVGYTVDVMGLSRADWMKQTGAQKRAAKVA